MQKVVDWFLPLFLVVGILFVVLANPEPLARDALCNELGICFSSKHAAFWNNLMYEGGLGVVVSIAFYWLLVKIPESTKRRRLRSFLSRSYAAFRKEVVIQFLFASRGSAPLDLVDKITEQSKFRSYFKQPSELVNGDKWHDVANNISERQLYDLLIVTESLRDDIIYVLNNTDIGDERSFLFLQSLRRAINAHNFSSTDYDDQKSLMGFFWLILAGWNPVEGYKENDPIQRIIDRI